MRGMRIALSLTLVLLAVACTKWFPPDPMIDPQLETEQVRDDPDDPAVWVNAQDPARSLVIGTNKVAAPRGAVYVFDLSGRVIQVVSPLDRPNNVDVEYGLRGPGGPMDIAVITERFQHRLRVFRVNAMGLQAIDGGRGIPVLDGKAGEEQEPMGVALYRRPSDGAVFAIVAPKTGGTTEYLWQYRIGIDAETHEATGRLVRRFGAFSGDGEIEAIVVDDELGYVYYADEEYGIRKWHADPDHADAGRELAVFGLEGFKRQREGLAILAGADGGGYIVASDQIPRASELRLYPRAGAPGSPHAHEPATATVVTAADSTDGLEVVSAGLPAPFSDGLLVMMNSRSRNFLLYRWTDVVAIADRSRLATAP